MQHRARESAFAPLLQALRGGGAQWWASGVAETSTSARQHQDGGHPLGDDMSRHRVAMCRAAPLPRATLCVTDVTSSDPGDTMSTAGSAAPAVDIADSLRTVCADFRGAFQHAGSRFAELDFRSPGNRENRVRRVGEVVCLRAKCPQPRLSLLR